MSADIGKRARLDRLFNPASQCQINVAVDHGNFGLLPGVEDIVSVIRRLLPGQPDSIQLPPGSARLYQSMGGRRPPLVLRLDRTNCYDGRTDAGDIHDTLIAGVAAAVRLDACAVVVNLLVAPAWQRATRQCVKNIAVAREECDRFGMPLMVEPLLFTDLRKTDRDPDRVAARVREACESGADMIKCDYTDAGFERIVEVAGGVPISVRGGDVQEPLQMFQTVRRVMDQGARGITFGRNIVRAKDPQRMLRAYAHLVHERGSPEKALGILG